MQLDQKSKEKLVHQHVKALEEHFGSVLILVTGEGKQGTYTYWVGGGNGVANYGAARTYVRHVERESTEEDPEEEDHHAHDQ
ncbi:MAG: hypothetical protein M5U26_08370 [Planctomycetota bacterium]|nr:hypothetical protein [Planctomycetota bacterium]